jgi:hypothetical protein
VIIAVVTLTACLGGLLATLAVLWFESRDR